MPAAHGQWQWRAEESAPPGQWRSSDQLPPGQWHGGQAPPASERTSERKSRSRGRNHRHRRRDTPGTDPSSLAATMDKSAFADFVLESLTHVDVEEFARIWPQVPRDVRAVVWRPPPNVTVDVDSLPENERAPMRACLNELRRERCKLLSQPKQQWQWDNQSWVFTPMSREVSQRFWQLFRTIPLCDPDPAKWGRTLTFLKDAPVKGTPFKADSTHAIDHSARTTSRSPSPPGNLRGQGSPARDSSARGSARESLRALAIGSPDAKPPPSDSKSEEFHKWVEERVKVDTANFSLEKWEVSKTHRLPKKTKPGDALATMSPLSLMSDAYQSTVQIYVRKLEKAINGLHGSSKEAKALTALCSSLNIDGGIRDHNLVSFLARLRAIDMVSAPQ